METVPSSSVFLIEQAHAGAAKVIVSVLQSHQGLSSHHTAVRKHPGGLCVSSQSEQMQSLMKREGEKKKKQYSRQVY